MSFFKNPTHEKIDRYVRLVKHSKALYESMEPIRKKIDEVHDELNKLYDQEMSKEEQEKLVEVMDSLRKDGKI